MGRKSYQQLFEALIKSVLDNMIPLNVESIRRRVSEKLGREVSWNTVKKYLLSLKEEGVVEEVYSGKIVLYKLK